MDEVVLLERHGAGVAVVTLASPPVNSLSEQVGAQLASIVDDLEAREDIAVVVVTGQGRAFCAGAEISQLEAFMNPDGAASRDRALQSLMDRVAALPQITIAAINGAAVGGGLELALACDLRVAARSAKVGLPEIRLGLIPGAGGTQRLPVAVGRGPALRMVAEGSIVPAADAPDGLIDEIVADERVQDVALAMARALAGGPKFALRAAKRAVAAAGTPGGYEIELDEFCRVAVTPDAREGVTAFLEDRHPVFASDKEPT